MNTATAAGTGVGAAVLGLIMLMYQIGRWRGGDPTPQIHFIAGVAIAALLMLGGGILGAMGGTAAALGESMGQYALESGAAAAGTGHVSPTGGERVGLGGVVLGLCLVALYAGLIKSGRRDLTSPVVRGALCGVWLGASAGLVGMAIGLIQTSGTTVGDLLINTV